MGISGTIIPELSPLSPVGEMDGGDRWWIMEPPGVTVQASAKGSLVYWTHRGGQISPHLNHEITS
jgi:hypothetical protein